MDNETHNADPSEAEAALSILNTLTYSPTANSTNTPPQDNLIVPYDPEHPSKRLGRPRKNLPTSEPPIDSSKNENEAILSKFRLDNQPVEGPGSRGGKNKVRSRGRIDNPRQRQRQHQHQKPKQKSQKPQKQMVLDLGSGNVGLKEVSPKKPKLVLKLKAKSTATPTPTPTVSACSRTTVRNSRNKLTRQLPGPLVGLYYDLYDENLVDEYGQGETLALGYPVTESPYAGDITFLIAYLLKFGDVINWEKNIGPIDFEKGLCLVEQEEQEEQEEPVVSPDMNILFIKLLTVLLNRKKEIIATGKAIAELKPMTESRGLPHEWTTTTTKVEPQQDFTISSPEDIVDPSHPEILIPSSHQPATTTEITYNPFYDNPNFESQGLQALDPPDRLILLRTLAQWSLTSSDAIKQAISHSIQAQDVPGDRETQYAARSVLYGTKNCLDTKRDSEIKLAKRKQDQDELKYVDPTSNPLTHNLNLRINQLVVGDCGFHVGRFYLARMSQEYNGGLASVKRMNQIKAGPPLSPLPSEFKLYVEDTYSMLVGALTMDGIEFDNGEEVVASGDVPVKRVWYEVAHSPESLEKFTDHLQSKLGAIPPSSVLYKPVAQLHEYLTSLLPLLKKQEDVAKITPDVRSTRKIVNYSVAPAYEEDEDEIMEYDENDDAGDDDNYEDVSEEDEEEYVE